MFDNRVRKHAGSQQHCPLKALQRFHQSVASPNRSLTVMFCAQPPAVDPADRLACIQVGAGSMVSFVFCVFEDHFSLSHSLVKTDNHPVASASRLPYLLHVEVWSCGILNRRAEPDMRSQEEMNMLSYLYWAWKCSWTKLCRSRGCCVLDEVKLEGCSSEVDPCRHGGKQYLAEK